MLIHIAPAIDSLSTTVSATGFPYLDPGSGSYLIQLLLAGLLGAGITIRMFWGRIKSFFTRKNINDEETGVDPGE
jgi:hypothetical protein